MADSEIRAPLSSEGCLRALSDLGPDVHVLKPAGNEGSDPKSPISQLRLLNDFEAATGSLASPRSSCSEALEGLSFLPSRLNSLGDDALAAPDFVAEDGPELNVDSVHKFIGSPRYHTIGGVPRPKILAHVSGTGLAPWEIHRPQKFVRDLVLRRCFSGRVLDSGCGIGDNALYVAKACPAAEVTAVDLVPRCLEFAAAKAGLRNMRGKVELVVSDLLLQDTGRLPRLLGPEADASFSVILDSSTFHCFSDADRELYVATLRRLLRPGGLIYVNCMSEEETRPGGPRRIPVSDLLTVFNRSKGWEVEGIEDSIIEFHPTFWGGMAKARLFTVRKLP